MKVNPFVQKLSNTTEFKSFNKKHPDAYVVAGFFVLDYESGNNMHQIDYYVPKEKKVAAFTLEPKINMQMLELMNEKAPEKLDINSKIDLDALQGIIDDEMKNRGFSEEIKKVIAILQTVEGKKLWNINCVLSGLHILKAHIDDDSKTVLKMEKTNMMDYVKKMPQQLTPDTIAQASQSGESTLSKKQIKEQMDKLDKIEAAIEIEKEKLSEAMKSSKEEKKESKAKAVKTESKKSKK